MSRAASKFEGLHSLTSTGLAAAYALAIALLAGCGVILVECPGGACASRIEFDGQTYSGNSAESMSIGGSDLTQVGKAEGGDSALANDAVYALDGVDPSQVVVMELREGEPDDYVVFSRGQIQMTPGLCRYYTVPPDGC